MDDLDLRPRTRLGLILTMLAHAADHTWSGDTARAINATAAALDLLCEYGAPPNATLDRIAQIQAGVDPETVVAYEALTRKNEAA